MTRWKRSIARVETGNMPVDVVFVVRARWTLDLKNTHVENINGWIFCRDVRGKSPRKEATRKENRDSNKTYFPNVTSS